MTAALTVPRSTPQARPDPGDPQVVLSGLGWDDYLRIQDGSSGKTRTRMIDIEGRPTILVPSRHHDWHGTLLGELVNALALFFDLEYEPAGRATFRRTDMKSGVEGDRRDFVGEDAVLMHGSVDIDLKRQAPPEIAIDVEVRLEDELRSGGRAWSTVLPEGVD